jgi:uncharacterized protein (TIRG00374 family)
MRGARSNPRLMALIGAKLAITGAVLYFLFSRFDIGKLSQSLWHFKPWTIAAGIVLLSLQTVLASARTQVLLRKKRLALRLPAIQRITLVGYFYSQSMLSFVGGDGVRIWLLARHGIPTASAGYVVVLDRIAGLATQLVFVVASWPAFFAMNLDWQRHVLLAAFSLACLAGIAALALLKYLPASLLDRFAVARHLREISNVAVEFARDARSATLLILLSAAIIMTNVFCIYTYFIGIGTAVSMWHVLVVAPTVFLLSMLPISIAGWGVREGAMSAGFALLGIGSDQSILVSVAFGLTLMLVSLPGSVLAVSGSTRTQEATSLGNV